MNDPLYLLASVRTLAHSLHRQPPAPAPAHDLLDAYATFSHRVAAHAHLLRAPGTPPPALAVLRACGNDLVRALRRDIHRPRMLPASFESADTDVSLRHHALRALTTILQFPALYSAFSEHDSLSSLFGDVLDACLAVPGQGETLSLSLHVLRSRSLPTTVLSPRRDDVAFILQQSLHNTQPVNIVLDGLNAVSCTVEHHPSVFLYPLAPLLPYAMANLFSECGQRRLHASTALGKFAIALVSQSDLSLETWQTFSNHIISFLEPCGGESQLDPKGTSLSHIVRATFSSPSRSYPRLAPTWIFSVLASLIVLSGPMLYSEPTVLRPILQSLAMALTHKRSVIRAFHPHVWRCFVWTFSQMLLNSENVEPSVISLAFHVIKQEVSGGIGVALATVLLSDRASAIWPDRRGERVSQALSVIEKMVQTECKHTRREGFMLLRAFTNDEQVRHQITHNIYEMPASILLSGAIIDVEWDGLPSIIHSIPKIPVAVHWLEEAEMAQHWKPLLVIWKRFAMNVAKKESDSSLVDVWLSILLACSRQFEHEQHIPTTQVLVFSAATITELLPSVLWKESQPDWGSWSVHDQRSSLLFIDRLWSVMQQAFVAANLAEAAELILNSILKLCASLMVTAPPSFLRSMHDITAPRLVIQSQRELWGVVATSLPSSESGLHWKELVKFLAIPICSWVLSHLELEAWGGLLRQTFAVGDSTTVAKITQCLQAKGAENWESIIPVLGLLMWSAHERDNLPSDELLFMINLCLIASYDRARHLPETLAQSLELLDVVRRVIISVPGMVVHILHALSNSLCLWIEDRTEVMSDDEFNSVAAPLYCDTLKVLEVLPLSSEALQNLEAFLASAFSRIPTPAMAPFAFEKYWRATYHGHSQFCRALPPKVKSCLTSFVAAYGGDLADELSLTTESQSQSSAR